MEVHRSRFNLRIKNPCIDPFFVTIQTISFLSERHTYVIHDEELEWQFEEFSVATYPIEHDLCGDLSYRVIYGQENLTPISKPFGFDASQRSLTF